MTHHYTLYTSVLSLIGCPDPVSLTHVLIGGGLVNSCFDWWIVVTSLANVPDPGVDNPRRSENWCLSQQLCLILGMGSLHYYTIAAIIIVMTTLSLWDSIIIDKTLKILFFI